ncbi:hypothetical protein T190607A01A_10057 [Tenacibaculum sp. 190524A05c]|uniref:Uncharacterized protein n=1 Tax=Tenacibaculum platacis TaxID=3137852 RepID=A0ABP1EE55_9FLAO
MTVTGPGVRIPLSPQKLQGNLKLFCFYNIAMKKYYLTLTPIFIIVSPIITILLLGILW